MRMSVDSLLAGEHYPPYRIGAVTVYLNGDRIDQVFDLDTEEGWVHRYMTDVDGNAVLDLTDTDNLVTHYVYGVVEVGL